MVNVSRVTGERSGLRGNSGLQSAVSRQKAGPVLQNKSVRNTSESMNNARKIPSISWTVTPTCSTKVSSDEDPAVSRAESPSICAMDIAGKTWQPFMSVLKCIRVKYPVGNS